MATDYYGTPSLLERITGADLVVTGRPRRLLYVEQPKLGDDSRVHGIFEIAVDSVLMGDVEPDVLRLRVLGEGRDEQATWTVPLDENGFFLFMLTRDVEPQAPENLYAPVFSGVYPIIDEDHVNVPEETLDDRVREEAGFEGNRVSLGGVRRLIENVLRGREDRQRQLEEIGLAELRDRPYPPIEEMPQQIDIGGRPATVDRLADQ
jgi:hypothetical protein